MKCPDSTCAHRNAVGNCTLKRCAKMIAFERESGKTCPYLREVDKHNCVLGSICRRDCGGWR